MAPPTYNAAHHHIGLKEKGSATTYGFTLAGGYVKQMQREGGGAPDFGGSTDLIGSSPSLSRWTQDDFTGGAYQWQWGRDDAMFADCLGFMTDPQGRFLLSCPPLILKQAFDPDSKSHYVSDRPKSMFVVGGLLFIAFGHGIFAYNIGTGANDWLSMPSADKTIVFAEYEPNDQVIWAITNNAGAGDRPSFNRYTAAVPPAATGFDSEMLGPTGTTNQTAFGAAIRDSQILVQIGRKLYLGDPPDNQNPTVNGTVTWTKIGRLPGRWKDSISFNGLTYILLNDGLSSPTYGTTLVAFDGDTIYPICRFPTNFYGKCMVEYAGRVFVGGVGTDINGSEQYAELYEVTGSSQRLVRSFGPETRRSLLSAGNWPQSIEDLVVFEGMLWFGSRGKSMIAYDITSDGFFGAAEIVGNTDLNIQKAVTGRGRMWLWGYDETDDTKHGVYRIAQSGDVAIVADNSWNPTLVTSDFAFEPGLKKRWSEIKIQTRYGGVASVEYSFDSGATWTALTGPTEVTNGQNYYTTYSLVGVASKEHIRFRIKLTTVAALTYHRELIAFTVTFAMLDTGKRAWSFTVLDAEEIERYDAEFDEDTTQLQDVGDVQDTIEDWAINKTPLTFTDLDGDVRDVQIVDYRCSYPVIGPKPTGETQPESHVSLTLLEV